jgi:hypothetical protein
MALRFLPVSRNKERCAEFMQYGEKSKRGLVHNT